METSKETRPGFNRSRSRSAEDIANFHKENEEKFGIETKIFQAIEKGCKLKIKHPTTGEVYTYRPKNLVPSVWQKPEQPSESDQPERGATEESTSQRSLSEEPLIL